MILRRHRAAALALTIALAACSHGPRGIHPQAAPAPVLDHKGEIDGIVALLDQGQKDAASKKVKALLKRNSADAEARVLDDSIEKDPIALLGPKSFAYTVRSSDTMLGLADRFLGNRLKSYQLARYNGIAVPAQLEAGKVLRIPGEAPRPAPSPRPEAPAPRPSEPVAPKPKPPVAPATVANPALAARMRAAGLAALNQGNVDRAVALLRRASQLNPGNALIGRDLERAERIARTVKARR